MTLANKKSLVVEKYLQKAHKAMDYSLDSVLIKLWKIMKML